MLRQTGADQAHFKYAKNQFVKALYMYDNLVERFPKSEIRTAGEVLDVKLFCRRIAWNGLWRPKNC